MNLAYVTAKCQTLDPMVLVWHRAEVLGLALVGLRFGTFLLSSITFIVRYRYAGARAAGHEHTVHLGLSRATLTAAHVVVQTSWFSLPLRDRS